MIALWLPKGIKSIILKEYGLFPYSRISYAQEAEDLILEMIFKDKKDGFYVDIGAHHPIKLSNTYKFYRKGWTGINIDAMPGISDIFNKIRPRDTNIECAISESSGEKTFFIFNEPALNTLSEEDAQRHIDEGIYHLVKKQQVKTHTINEILDQYVSSDRLIDFMSIDIEGLDKKVILDLNFNRYKPEIILFEDHNYSSEGNQINEHLEMNGYYYLAKTIRTVFYKRKSNI